MATNSEIEQIKERLNIVDVAGRYLDLKKSGKNHFAVCPFHAEKTGSFSLNGDLGRYKCFGCGEAGDVITLVQKLEGLDFGEALEVLAREAGVKLTKNKKDSKEEKSRARQFELHSLALKFYKYILLKHELGKQGLAYLKSRGLKGASVEEFGLGYAPATQSKKDYFVGSALKKGYSRQELLESGLAVEQDGKIIDKFRNRVVFAIHDLRGRPIGFTGRIIKPSEYAPKYLNSPESKIFHKSSTVYGLYQGRNSIREKDTAILVEGSTDVISSHQVGVGNIVAPLGTSVTEGHIKEIKRYTENLAICFDQDLAGESAVKRAVQLAQNLEMEVSAIPLVGVKDVDELIHKDPKIWQKTSQKPIAIVDYILGRLIDRIKVSTADGKVEVISEIAPFVVAIKNQIRKDHYISEIARQLSVDKKLVLDGIAKAGQVKNKKFSPADMSALKTNIIVRSTVGQEEYVVGLLMQNPDIGIRLKSALKPKIFSDLLLQAFVREFRDILSVSDFQKFIKELESDMKIRVSDLALYGFVDEKEDKAKILADIRSVLRSLEIKSVKMQIETLNEELKRGSLVEESGFEDEILNSIKKLTAKLDKLQKSK